jgi:oxygen-dependent protoporphyrinogen oxidase
VSARIAGRLLEGLGPSRSAGLTATLAALPTTHDVTLVTLLLEDRTLTLAGAPVGSGVLVADGPVRAKAMTHASAKWGWLAAALPSDHHVVRLSYGGTEPAADLPTDDASDLLRVALEDLHRLLAGSLGSPIVRAALVTPWRGALSRPVVGRAARIAALDQLVTEWSGLAVTGSAVAGNGLAGVVGRSRREAARTLAVRSDRAPGPTSIPRSP